MQRLFSKNATGIAPDGRWYAGDVNALQDAVAAQSDFTQFIDLGGIRIGASGLQILGYGSGEARLTGAIRTDGILRALGGLYAGAFTTAQRDAIASGFKPYGLVILNTTANQLQVNLGTDAVPSWKPVGVDPSGSIDLGGQTTNNYIIVSGRPGDSNPRFQIREDGQIEWGLGNAPSDVILTHPSSGILNFSLGKLQVAGNDVIVSLSGVTAARPPANSLPVGSLYMATDGLAGKPILYRTNGTSWSIAASSRPIVYAAPIPLQLVSGTTETDLINVTIKGGDMGPNGQLNWKFHSQTVRPSASAEMPVTIKVYWGGSVISTWNGSSTNVGASANGSNGGSGLGQAELIIRNMNSETVQNGYWDQGLPGFGGIPSSFSCVTLAKDTTQDQVLRVTATLLTGDGLRQFHLYSNILTLN